MPTSAPTSKVKRSCGLGSAWPFPLALSLCPGVTGSGVIPAKVAPRSLTSLPTGGKEVEEQAGYWCQLEEVEEVGREMGSARQAPHILTQGEPSAVAPPDPAPGDQAPLEAPAESPWRPEQPEARGRPLRPRLLCRLPGQLLTSPHGWGQGEVVTVLEEPTRK